MCICIKIPSFSTPLPKKESSRTIADAALCANLAARAIACQDWKEFTLSETSFL